MINNYFPKKKTSLLILILLLSICFRINAQNNALDIYYDEWASVEGMDCDGFSGLTIESWINLDHYYNLLYTGSFIAVKEAKQMGGTFYYGFLLLVLSDCPTCPDPGTLAFGLNFNGGPTHKGLHSNTKIPLDEWVHVAATWNGDSMSVFINGIFDKSLDVAGLGQFYDPDQDTVSIGTRKIASFPADATFGRIDELRIWNVARSEAEIRETMYKELNGSETGLYAYYQLNEGSGQTITDLTANGFDGTLGDDISDEPNDPDWVSSTSPLPYNSIQDGDWDVDATWDTEQLAPVNDWAIVEINDEVTIDTDEAAEDLTINSSGKLTLDAANTLSVDGDLIIKSDGTGTGSLIDNGTLSYTSATVERYLTQNDWHFIGIPVSASTANVFYMPGSSQFYLRTHIESTNSWGTWITDPATNLILGRGYEVWVDDNVNQDETVEFAGTLNTGNYTTGSGGFYDLEYTSGHGLNLISNPYPSAITANIHSWTKTNLANSVWVWSGTTGNYLYWNGVDGTNGNGYGTLTGGVIPAMQGFFVEATGSNPSLTLPQTDRTHSDQGYYKSSGNPNSLKLAITGNGFEDAIFISFREDASNSFDSEYDVRKLFGLNEAPQFYSITTDGELSINSLALVEENIVVAVGLECDEAGQFEIIASEIGDFSQGVMIYLEDLITNELIEVVEGSILLVDHIPGNPVHRFNVHFTDAVSVEENTNNGPKLWTSRNMVYIQGVENNSVLDVFDLSGAKVFSQDLPASEFSKLTLSVNKGYYLLRLVSQDQSVSRKVFIN